MATAVGPRAQRLSRDDVARAAQPQAPLPVSPAALLDRIRLISRTLDEHPGLTSRELAERLGADRRRLLLLLLRLEERGHVAHADRRWFLAGAAPVR